MTNQNLMAAQGEIKAQRTSMRWFRMYAEFASDPKVQMLSETDQRRFLMLLCLRCGNGDVTLQDDECAFQLRVTEAEYAQTKAVLIARGLIDTDNKPTAWERRQYVSDTSKNRVSRHRERKKSEPNPACNVTVTPPDTDTDTDTESERKKVLAPLPAAKSCKRGARLPDDWILPSDWREWVRVNCPAAGDAAIDREAMKFANFWQSKAGQSATKLDWRKTWQNWCLTAFATAPLRNPVPAVAQPGRARAALERMMAEAAQ